MRELFMRRGLIALLLAMPFPGVAAAQIFDPVFSDHAVLQRDQPVRLWGTVSPGERIEITFGKRHVAATAGADGRWKAILPPQAGGGTYVLAARSALGRRQTLTDIAIGDVFLCSGQSNMEFSLARSAGAAAEIAVANDPTIRLATMPAVSAALPVARLAAPLEWQPATPASVADYSAVCWYMARALRRTVKVPIGLIDASWGGSTLQAWLSPAALARGGGDLDMIDLLELYNRDPATANLVWGERWQQWWLDAVSPTDRPWTRADTTGWMRVPALDLWEKWPDPVLADFNGMVWYRTSVRLTAAQAAQAATLDVGAIDEIDQTWVNGRAVGTGAGDEPRHYPLPAGTLRAGDNVVTVNILDTWETGGPFGPAGRRAITFSDGTRVPLSGSWFYRKVDHARPRPPRSPWHPASGQGTLYNGMIAPLGAYGLRAMAWYQGESNTTDRRAYTGRLEALYADRRATFGSALPILIVQLANFGKQVDVPVDSDWAEIREAQRRQVLNDRKSGLAVTIDVGNPDDLHPTDKRTVGERLARSALAIVYGRKIPRAGPQPLSARRQGNHVIVDFGDVTGRLSAAGPIAFELCGEAQQSCRRAPGEVRERTARLPFVDNATRVRYCWADSPRCTLRDAIVPVTPFEMQITATATDQFAIAR